MAREFKPGEIVPQSCIYTITHDPAHADMPHEVTVIKGRRFPTCRHCKGIGGTEGSNPPRSTGESVANLTFGGASHQSMNACGRITRIRDFDTLTALPCRARRDPFFRPAKSKRSQVRSTRPRLARCSTARAL